MEYVEPPIIDWLNDNPLVNVGSDYGGFDSDEEEDPFDLDGPLDDSDLEDSPSDSMVVDDSDTDL